MRALGVVYGSALLLSVGLAALITRSAAAQGTAAVAAQSEATEDPVAEQHLAEQSGQRRELARYRTRFAVGGNIGYADLIGSDGLSTGLQLGLRQQLARFVGLHTQLLTQLAEDYVSSDARIMRTEFGCTFTPYLGPIGRFYVGPALFAGYRHYADTVSGASASDHVRIPKSRAFLEWGPRFGVLLGAEEQIDITGLVSTSLSNNAGLDLRLIIGAGYEFR
jgi:hypothetical protein